MKKRNRPPTSIALSIVRKVAGIDQKDLADLARLSVDTISAYERGEPAPSMETLRSLAGLMVENPRLVDEALGMVADARSPQRTDGHPLSPGPRALRRIQEIVAAANRGTGDLLLTEMLRIFRQEQAKEARREAGELWARLKRYCREQREALVSASQLFRSWALVELLCAESTKAAADKAGKAVELATLALYIAERCPGDEAWLSGLRAYALVHLGNALRVQGQMPKARESFARARGLWRVGGGAVGEVLDGTRVPDLEASLQIEEGNFAEALRLLDQALEQAGPSRRAGLLINKASALELSGDEEGSLRVLLQMAPLVDRQREPRQYFALRFNLLTTLCHLDRYKEAEPGLGEMRQLVEELGNGLDRLRVVWLGGTVAAGLGRLAEATSALEEVREELNRHRIYFDAGLAALELAAVYLDGDHSVKARQLAQEALAIFQRQELQPHALAAVRLFVAAAERNEATAVLARRLVGYLRRALDLPELQFEPGD